MDLVILQISITRTLLADNKAAGRREGWWSESKIQSTVFLFWAEGTKCTVLWEAIKLSLSTEKERKKKNKNQPLVDTHRRFSNHPPSKHFVSHTKIRLGIRAEYQIRPIKGAQGHSLLSNQKDLKLQYPCNKRNKIKSSCFFPSCLKIERAEKSALSFPV